MFKTSYALKIAKIRKLKPRSMGRKKRAILQINTMGSSRQNRTRTPWEHREAVFRLQYAGLTFLPKKHRNQGVSRSWSQFCSRYLQISISMRRNFMFARSLICRWYVRSWFLVCLAGMALFQKIVLHF